ncbi:hypothetical protein DZS_38130 [Dickeya ananatis]
MARLTQLRNPAMYRRGQARCKPEDISQEFTALMTWLPQYNNNYLPAVSGHSG